MTRARWSKSKSGDRTRRRASRSRPAPPLLTLPTPVDSPTPEGTESVPEDVETLENDFFDATRDPPGHEDEPLETPCDPILERKMSLAVQVRRARFTRLVKGVVVCAALLLLVVTVVRLAPGPRTASAAVAPQTLSTQTAPPRASTSASTLRERGVRARRLYVTDRGAR